MMKGHSLYVIATLAVSPCGRAGAGERITSRASRTTRSAP